MDYITFVIEDRNIYLTLQIITKILDKYPKTWFLYKKKAIRLRVLKKYSKEINELLKGEFKQNINSLIYEPEMFIFGGEKSIIHVYNVLSLISKISCYFIFNTNEFGYKIKLLDEILEKSKCDEFEIFDIWSMIYKFRNINHNIYKKLVIDNFETMYKNIYTPNDEKECINDIISEISKEINKIYSLYYEGNLVNGYREVLCYMMIFIMNILLIDVKQQYLIASLFKFFKNPLIKKEIE